MTIKEQAAQAWAKEKAERKEGFRARLESRLRYDLGLNIAVPAVGEVMVEGITFRLVLDQVEVEYLSKRALIRDLRDLGKLIEEAGP